MGHSSSRERSRKDDAHEIEDESSKQSLRDERDSTEPARADEAGRIPGKRGSSGGKRRVQRSATARRDSVERRGRDSNGGYVAYDPGPDRQALGERYEIEVREGQAKKLQRLESEFGSERVSRWAEEGMSVQTMGKPRDMQAFRKRQEKRSEEIPTDIERRNEASKQRNAAQNQEDGPAGATGVPDVVRSVVSSPGRSMDETVQREMEAKMGSDFSDVQIHSGPKAAAAAESINARAFTVGNHVAFNKGEYNPKSPEGKRVMAHELTHVRQQTDGQVSMLPKPGLEHPGGSSVDKIEGGTIQRLGAEIHIQPKLEVSSPDSPAEQEAERVAQQVVGMEDRTATDDSGGQQVSVDQGGVGRVIHRLPSNGWHGQRSNPASLDWTQNLMDYIYDHEKCPTVGDSRFEDQIPDRYPETLPDKYEGEAGQPIPYERGDGPVVPYNVFPNNPPKSREATFAAGILLDYPRPLRGANKMREDGDMPTDINLGVSESEAESRVGNKMDEKATRIDVSSPLYQHEYDALVDFAYGAGAGALNSNITPIVNDPSSTPHDVGQAMASYGGEGADVPDNDAQMFVNANYNFDRTATYSGPDRDGGGGDDGGGDVSGDGGGGVSGDGGEVTSGGSGECVYTVQQSDVGLAQIAKDLDVADNGMEGARKIVEWNDELEDLSTVFHPGQELIIEEHGPGASNVAALEHNHGEESGGGGEEGGEGGAGEEGGSSDREKHTVESGDTLAGIASEYGIDDWKKVARWNNIDPQAYQNQQEYIHPGDELYVEPAKSGEKGPEDEEGGGSGEGGDEGQKPEKSPTEKIEELSNQWQNSEIDMIALGKGLQPYCDSHGKAVRNVLNDDVSLLYGDNLAGVLVYHSSDSELANFETELLQDMKWYLNYGITDPLGDADEKNKEYLKRVKEALGKDEKKDEGKADEESDEEEKEKEEGKEPKWIKIAKNETGQEEKGKDWGPKDRGKEWGTPETAHKHSEKKKKSNPRIEEYLATAGITEDWEMYHGGSSKSKGVGDHVYWCGAFVYWCLKQAGYSPNPPSQNGHPADADAWEKWGEGTTNPEEAKYGSVAVVNGGSHVTFLIGKDGNKIECLGGNQGDKVGKRVYDAGDATWFGLPSGFDTSNLKELKEVEAEEGADTR